MQLLRGMCHACLLCGLLVGVAPATEPSSSNWLARIRLLPGEYERNHRTIKAAFRQAVGEAQQSTVSVLAGGSQVALGTIIDPAGYIATKASELPSEVTVQLHDGRQVAAQLVGLHPDFDLALLKIPATRLSAVTWANTSVPSVGSWLITTGLTEEPTAIGIISTAARPLPKPQAILGVGLEQFGQTTRVNRVIPGSSAARAGLQVGDIIASVNGQTMQHPQAVSGTIRNFLPGDRISLTIQRSGKSLSLPATLGDANRIGNMEQTELMESLGGPLSTRRTGFPYVIEHDTVLRPKDCGGPVVDLDGKVVGMNIARVSRVSSYALPANVIQPVLADLMAGKYPPLPRELTLQDVSASE